jgi:hypothetical protein
LKNEIKKCVFVLHQSVERKFILEQGECSFLSENMEKPKMRHILYENGNLLPFTDLKKN